ncbi:hypothetical protein DSECCO2_333110 [anaerobic digester metagenome]
MPPRRRAPPPGVSWAKHGSTDQDASILTVRRFGAVDPEVREKRLVPGFSAEELLEQNPTVLHGALLQDRGPKPHAGRPIRHPLAPERVDALEGIHLRTERAAVPGIVSAHSMSTLYRLVRLRQGGFEDREKRFVDYPTTLTGEPDAPRGIAPVTERFRVTVELP